MKSVNDIREMIDSDAFANDRGLELILTMLIRIRDTMIEIDRGAWKSGGGGGGSGHAGGQREGEKD
jgi:hypothetical protein